MVKYENLKDEEIYEIIAKEIERFNKLILGHKRLLEAIGDL